MTEVLSSSKGDDDEYTKMLIRQEIDSRMTDIEARIEEIVANQKFDAPETLQNSK